MECGESHASSEKAERHPVSSGWIRQLKHDFLDDLTAVCFILENARNPRVNRDELVEDLTDLKARMERQFDSFFITPQITDSPFR